MTMMMPHLTLKLESRTSQVLTPRLQYAVRLLQLSSADYEQELHALACNNPFLELDDERSRATQAQAPPPAPGHEHGLDDEDFAGREGVSSQNSLDASDSSDWPETPPSGDATSSSDDCASAPEAPGSAHDEPWGSEGSGAHAGAASEGHASALERMAAQTDLRAHLRAQANLLVLGERDHALVCAVIESLDDDGYLRLDLGEIAALGSVDDHVEPCELSTALKLVQSLEPSGVGARSLSECLALQVRELSLDPELKALVGEIVSCQLPRLAQRDTAGLARLLGRPAAEIEAACAVVRALDPRPGARFGASRAQFIKPDVIARKLQGQWVVQLNAAAVPGLTLNRAYATLFAQHREARHAELASHLQEARWAVRNVEQRFSTILAVAQAIVRRQSGFLEYGALAMKPLALREIAQEIGVHESTVCRVINNKFLAAPAGLIELKQFFSRAMPVSGGGACSPMAIRGLVREIIGVESPLSPLSDVEIAQRLARQGLSIARRTVTKYRQMLKIPAVELRRAGHGACRVQGWSLSDNA